jgi:hypothetical protein
MKQINLAYTHPAKPDKILPIPPDALHCGQVTVVSKTTIIVRDDS